MSDLVEDIIIITLSPLIVMSFLVAMAIVALCGDLEKYV